MCIPLLLASTVQNDVIKLLVDDALSTSRECVTTAHVTQRGKLDLVWARSLPRVMAVHSKGGGAFSKSMGARALALGEGVDLTISWALTGRHGSCVSSSYS